MASYRPLRLDRPEFRLLRLHSTRSTKLAQGCWLWSLVSEVLRVIFGRKQPLEAEAVPISCDLYHSSRDEHPYYETLSYTWGQDGGTAPVIVNGQTRQVTTNLRDALQHIRHGTEDVHLWIDALCINQNDAEEKGHQVGQMRGIYGEASKTIAWLGLASEGSDATMVELDRIGKWLVEKGIRDKMIALGRLASNMKEEYGKLEQEINDDLAEFYEAAMPDIPKVIALATGCHALSSREYWTRVWILQEYVVSAKVQIRCGRQTISFEHFHGCLLYLPFLTITIVQRLHRHIVSIMETQDVTELYGQFMMLCNTTVNQQANNISGMRLRAGDADKADMGMTLIRLLAKVHIGVPSGATDNRDRIFALLGMAKDAGVLGIVPDYKEDTSAADVYTSAARKIIKAGNADLLSLAQHRQHRPDIPSWVPDWTREILRPCGQLPWDSSFDTSAGAMSLPASSESNEPTGHDEIRLSGYILDTVEQLAPDSWCPSPEGVNKDHSQLPGYLEGIRQLCQKSHAKLGSGDHARDPYPNPKDRTSAYLRVPVADMEQYGIGFIRRALSDPQRSDSFPGLQKGYEGVLEEIRTKKSGGDSGIQSEEVSGMFNMLGWQTYRRAMLLKSGLVGLGPARIEIGDVVVIFHGAKFPYVLRKCEGSGSGRRWSLIGEAYVHGIMYGELFQSPSKGQSLESEDFVLC